MSGDDFDAFSGTRPYECCACGVRMRTRGIDGRCIACHEAPAVRCATCARVRFDPGGDWQDHPGRLTREVEGQCRTCGDWAKRQREIQRAREDRRLLRDRARGYGPGTGDPFAGF